METTATQFESEMEQEKQETKSQESPAIETKVVQKVSQNTQKSKFSNDAIIESKKKPEIIKITVKEGNKTSSSDSLVQHVHNLENPSDEKHSRTSFPDPMENKLEREYRKMFSTTKSKESKASYDRPVSEYKSASILKRRFEALRRGLIRKDESSSKKIVPILVESSKKDLLATHKDASVTSDPPSLIGRSFSNTKKYTPEIQSMQQASKKSHYCREEKSSAPLSQNPVDSECQGVKGMFKLWGKKFNFEEDAYGKKRATPLPSYEQEKKTEKEVKEKVESTKKEGRKFFFFKKKSKDKNKEVYTPKKHVTAGRCEIRDGLVLKIGAASRHKISKIPEETGEITRTEWLKKFLSSTIESVRSVNVRWHNSLYATSSSTVFELLDTVYKNTGVVFRSRSQSTTGDSSFYRSYTKHKVNFVQDIEAWMIPKTFIDKPVQQIPIKIYSNNDIRDKHIEGTTSDQKWYIEKSEAFSHKIEVVIQSNNFSLTNKKVSSEYLKIDIPKDFFDTTSSDESKRNPWSDEEVYKIVEYETNSEIKRERKKNATRNLEKGDHVPNDIKVIVSIQDSKNIEANILETVIKRPPTHRDVVIQGSNVNIPKRCNVIGVGIITQRDLREFTKPILNIQDYLSDEESEPELPSNQKKCEFAESYLQEYYRNWTPLGLDGYSWRASDSHVKSCSEKSVTSFLYQGDGSKSCPNVYEDFQTATFVNSCESVYSPCPYNEQCVKVAENFTDKFFHKFKKQPSKAKTETDVSDKRVLPKDSLEVFKRRKIYAASNKSGWANIPTEDNKCVSVPSIESKGCAPNSVLIECPRKETPITLPPKKKPCKKHVSMPDCETMNYKLGKQYSDKVEGILTFKGAICDTCKQKGAKCPNHRVAHSTPPSVIPQPPCKEVCETKKKPACSKRNSPSCNVNPLYPPSGDAIHPKSSVPGIVEHLPPRCFPPPDPCAPPPCPASLPPCKSPQLCIPTQPGGPTPSQQPSPPCSKCSKLSRMHKLSSSSGSCMKCSQIRASPRKKSSPCKKPSPCKRPSPCKKQSPCKKPSPCKKHSPCKKPAPCQQPASKTRSPCGICPPTKTESFSRNTSPCKKSPSSQQLASKKPSPCGICPPTKKESLSKNTSLCKKPPPCHQPVSKKSSPCGICPPTKKESLSRNTSPCKKSPSSQQLASKKPSPCGICPPTKKESLSRNTSPCKKTPSHQPVSKKSSPCGICPPTKKKSRSRNTLPTKKTPPCQKPPSKKASPCGICPPAKKKSLSPCKKTSLSSISSCCNKKCPSNESQKEPCKKWYRSSPCEKKPGKCCYSSSSCNVSGTSLVVKIVPTPKKPCTPTTCSKNKSTDSKSNCGSLTSQISLRAQISRCAQGESPKPLEYVKPKISPIPCMAPPQNFQPGSRTGLHLKNCPSGHATLPKILPCQSNDKLSVKSGSSCGSVKSQKFPWPCKDQKSNQSLPCYPPEPQAPCTQDTPIDQAGRGCANPQTPPCFPKPSCPSKAIGSGTWRQRMGLSLKMKPSKKKPCTIAEPEREEGVIRLCSNERISIKIKQQTPSTEEIREIRDPLNIRVQDEDGQTLYERRDYNSGKQCHQALGGGLYRDSKLNRVATPVTVTNMEEQEVNKDITGLKSEQSLANLIEIQLKLRISQGDKTTEVNIANENEESYNKSANIGKTTPEVFVVKDAKNEIIEESNPKNDINIKITVRNFKPKHRNIDDKACTEDFSKKISDKFQTVSTGYSDAIVDPNDDQIFSIHRATINLSSSVEKSEGESHSNISNEIQSKDFTDYEPNLTYSSHSTELLPTDGTEDEKIEIKSVSSKKDSSHSEKLDETNTIESELPDFNDTDDQDATLLGLTTSNECTVESEISKHASKENKKELLKKVMQKAVKAKNRNKESVRELREMLKIILTDSSENDDLNAASNELLKDVTYTSLKPNYFRDTDSMNNYYQLDSTLPSIKDSSIKPIYPTKGNSQTTRTSDSDEEVTTYKGCMCSKVAAKLNDASLNLSCCCRLKSRKDEETNCDIRNDDDLFLLNYRATEHVDVETQNSKHFSNINSVSFSIHSKSQSISKIAEKIRACETVEILSNRTGENGEEMKTVVQNRSYVKDTKYFEESAVDDVVDNSDVFIPSRKPSQVARTIIPCNYAQDYSTDILQSYAAKKAVLEIYAEKSQDGDHFVAKLPKFVQERESEIARNYAQIATNSYKSVCRQNIVIMSVKR